VGGGGSEKKKGTALHSPAPFLLIA
jgi:hypothetical protein